MYDIIMVHDSSNLQLLGMKSSDTTKESLMGKSLEQWLKHSANSQPGDKIQCECNDLRKLSKLSKQNGVGGRLSTFYTFQC